MEVKQGQIYRLGKHYLFCCDSTNPKTIEKILHGKKVDMLYTDPPYDMLYSGGGFLAENTRQCKKRLNTMVKFNPYILNFLPYLDLPTYYIFTAKNGIPKYLDIFKGYNFNILVWCKTNPTPFTHNTFLPDIEYLLFFSKKGGKIWNNSLKPMRIYNKYFISEKERGRKDGGGDLHPTMKPIEFIKDKIKISSNENGIVLDLFGGSGSTLIACEELNRICYTMEINENYCKVIIERWETLTGEKAALLN